MTSESTPHGPSRYRWVVFSLLGAGYLFVNFHRLCPAVVAVDLMRDLDTGAGILGLLASAYFYPYAVMQIPSGLLSDSLGPRKTITGFFLIAGLASILFGMAGSVKWAMIARVLVGLGVSMYFVPTMKILTRWFKVSEFALMTGFLMGIGGIGSLSAAGPLAYLSATFGWRSSFVFIGVITVAISVAIWFFVRNAPEDMGLPSVEHPTTSDPGSKQTIALWQGVKMVLGAFRFWSLAGWFFFDFGIFFSFAGLWGGPYLMHIYGLSKPEAGNILSMAPLAIVIGSPIHSLLSDHLFRSRKKTLVGSALAMVLLTVPLAFFPADLNVPLLYAWCFLFGFFGSAAVTVGFASIKEQFPVEIAGTAVGLVNLMPFLGAAIMQPVLGLILESHGKTEAGFPPEAYQKAFFLYFITALIAFLSACCIRETIRSGKAASA
ncbi:MAG TPA: MFS transporter [bacterium]|nr:MFS transporter [bacterium]